VRLALKRLWSHQPSRARKERRELKTQAAPEAEVLGIPFARNSHPMWVFDRETLAFLDVNERSGAPLRLFTGRVPVHEDRRYPSHGRRA
jgi:hypothetical protein